MRPLFMQASRHLLYPDDRTFVRANCLCNMHNWIPVILCNIPVLQYPPIYIIIGLVRNEEYLLIGKENAMYEIIIILKSGREIDLEINDYATGRNTFSFYANQKEMFGIDEILFVNHEYYDDSVVA